MTEEDQGVGAMIAGLPDEAPPLGLDARVFATATARKRRWWLAVPIMAAAAAVVAFLLIRRSDEPTVLAMQVRHGDTVHRSSSAALGDILVVDGPKAALRIYLNDTIIVGACDACTHLEAVAKAPGVYRASQQATGADAVLFSAPVEVH